MKITLLLQIRNEINSGHIHRFLEQNKGLYDYLAVFDDASDDGTYELLLTKSDLIIRNEIHSFRSELSNRNQLYSAAKNKFSDTDWFLWLDADEILLASRDQLNNLLELAEERNFDSVSIPLLNLWKSAFYYRKDSGFNDLRNIRFWRNLNHLEYPISTGLHKPLYPLGLNATLKYNDLYVIHFGFCTTELIIQKFTMYKHFGQRGVALWRLIDESNLELEHVSVKSKYLGERAEVFFENLHEPNLKPSASSIYEYLWRSRSLKIESNELKPIITIVCLIYSGLDWLEFQYGELLNLSREFAPGQVKILFVANDASKEVLDYLKENNIPHIIGPGRKNENEWYINSVYRSYNFGVLQSNSEYVLLTNSDMAYSEGFLYSLLSKRKVNKYLVAKLIESGRLLPAPMAIKKNLGKNLRNFKRYKFEKLSRELKRSHLSDGGLFMPALVNRSVFLSNGGFPEGNIRKIDLDNYLEKKPYQIAKVGEDLIPGDFAFIKLLSNQSIAHQTVNDSIAYHFQEGEKSEFSHGSRLKTSSGISIVNDRLIGVNSEPTLWNYLMEDLRVAGIRSKGIELGTSSKFPYRLIRRDLYQKPHYRLMFRNATFLRKISGPWNQIVLVQDRVQNKKIYKLQNIARKNAVSEVTNAEFFINDHIHRNLHNHAYLIPLPVNPAWEKAPIILRNKKNEYMFTAIFVGAFNETKGWNTVKEIIYEHSDIYFILVSKYPNDEHGLQEIKNRNWEIHRCLQADTLINLVDSSDFLILGSNFESQCLAAMEASTRGKPVLMKPTGLLSSLPPEDRDLVGIFNSDLKIGLNEMLDKLNSQSKFFNPKSILAKYKLNSNDLRNEWLKLILDELEFSFIPYESKNLINRIKSRIPSGIKIYLRKRLAPMLKNTI